LHPEYSQKLDFISELGAPDAPFPAVMNLFGIAFVGILLFVFSVSLRRAQPPGPLCIAGSLLLAISGVAFVAVGLLPCDKPGCSLEAPSAIMQGHLVAGLLAMVTQAMAPLAFGLRLFSGTGPRWYAVTSLTLGLVALLALFLLFGTEMRLLGPGIAQKAFQFSADIWVFVSALLLLRAERSSA
jgi:hypothetical membrane protein